MFKKMNLFFIAMSLAACVPVKDTNKSKLDFIAKDKKEVNEAKAATSSQGSSSTSETSVVKLTATQELRVKVKKILDANCLSCHGSGKGFQEEANLAPSIEAIEKDFKLISPGDITKSILYTKITVGSMKVYLPESRDADVIKEWILSINKQLPDPVESNSPAPVTTDSTLKNYISEIQMGSRSYVESVLLQVFDAEGTTAANYIQTDILQRVEFGGSCDFYATGEMANAKVQFPREQCFNSIGIVQPPNNNSMRYSLSTKVCEKLVADKDRLNAVRKKIYENQIWGAPTDDKLLTAWRLFHQSTDTDANALTALKELKNVTSNNNDEAWKLIILTLCLSPEWQSL